MNASLTSNAGTSGTDGVSAAQIADVVRVVEAAARSAAEEVTGQLVASGTLTKTTFQQVVESRDRIKAAVSGALRKLIPELAKLRLSCLSLGERLTLKPADGKRTIAKANKVFGYIDSDLKGYGTDVPSEARGETEVVVHEILEDSTFEQMFGSLSASLDNLCFTQDQIIGFVETHRKWLRTDGYATFFLFKVNGKFFVAYVDLLDDGRLKVDVYRFSDDDVWSAGYRPRVVVPQLTPMAT
ncbi:MAG: hypothetical protein AAB726_03705 [Patescibacteria group bacterium]